MARNYSNIAVDTTLTAGINAAVTSCVVTSATGWPAAPFAAVIDPGLVTEEVVEVTVKVGTTFTITRGFDGTAAAIHALGAVVRHAAIAGDFTDLQAADTTNASAISTHTALTTTAHGGIVASTDPRLTDARTPLAHASTHASIGSDPVTLTQGQITNLTADLGLKAPLASPIFTGIPAAPTAAPGTNTTQLATTAFVLANGGSGTVTSVALTVPGVLFSVAGSPVTTSGTLALSLLTQTANTVLAGPASGGAVAPTMRALVVADLPLITPSKGGTGVANADANTLTLGAATTISGGGTLALAGFTLTVPATGTLALLATANVFTAAQAISINDSVTNTTTTLATLTHNSSGTPAASFGSRLLFNLDSATVDDRNAASLDTIWTTATDASRTSAIVISTVNSAAALAEALRITPTQLVLPPISYTVAAPRLTQFAQTGTGISWSGNGLFFHTSGQSNAVIGNLGIHTSGTRIIGWTSAAADASNPDTALGRNGVAIVEVNNGTGGQWGALKAGTRDAGTTTITDGLTLGHQSTGTPAAGLGTGIALNINSSTTADQNAARITAEWVDATHATRKARAKFNVFDTATREGFRIEADGTNPMIGFLGAAATARVAITGSRAGNAALASLLTELASKGLITDSTSA